MNNYTISPFHEGEKFIQNKLNVRSRIEKLGGRVIRDHMPEQHRTFYRNLPHIFISITDESGYSWASILCGFPDLIESPTPNELIINCLPNIDDPLHEKLKIGQHIGLLGIMLYNKRRNRLSGIIKEVNESSFKVSVLQSFGNCPQYITKRSPRILQPKERQESHSIHFNSFSNEIEEFIKSSDTFFVSSYKATNENTQSDGADISHRGGKQGFVKIDNKKKLTIPDYSGNFHFNTLGNFIVTPKAGLLFIDFSTGHILTMTGTPNVIFNSPAIKGFTAAERLWTFTLDHGYLIKNSLPLVWE